MVGLGHELSVAPGQFVNSRVSRRDARASPRDPSLQRNVRQRWWTRRDSNPSFSGPTLPQSSCRQAGIGYSNNSVTGTPSARARRLRTSIEGVFSPRRHVASGNNSGQGKTHVPSLKPHRGHRGPASRVSTVVEHRGQRHGIAGNQARADRSTYTDSGGLAARSRQVSQRRSHGPRNWRGALHPRHCNVFGQRRREPGLISMPSSAISRPSVSR